MLRITVEENTQAVVIKLEGRITGPWATELDRLWLQTEPTLTDRRLSLDLRETTFADPDGIRILRGIYSQTGAAILAGTPWTQYLAEEIVRATRKSTEVEG